ncbi:hypothetical protein GCM10009827_040780 [Dactylosporangium maewongense]|uniref:Uncharacterized protein n=1 Tax=Dactylosporangium maewongense TaxID=634393 RepID=A0ABP4LCG4_9ACTN
MGLVRAEVAVLFRAAVPVWSGVVEGVVCCSTPPLVEEPGLSIAGPAGTRALFRDPEEFVLL